MENSTDPSREGGHSIDDEFDDPLEDDASDLSDISSEPIVLTEQEILFLSKLRPAEATRSLAESLGLLMIEHLLPFVACLKTLPPDQQKGILKLAIDNFTPFIDRYCRVADSLRKPPV